MRLLTFFLSLVVSNTVIAATTVSWPDLVPKMTSAAIQLPQLSDEELATLTEIIVYRGAMKRRELTNEESKSYQTHLQKAEAINLDVEAILAIRDRIIKERNTLMTSVRTDLDSSDIKIAGFVVPLEMDGMLSTQFLLVPSAGACIHTPPPPVNQTVVVNFPDGYEIESLYTPVWVEGIMYTENLNMSVALSDGTQDIQAGYTLKATAISRYK